MLVGAVNGLQTLSVRILHEAYTEVARGALRGFLDAGHLGGVLIRTSARLFACVTDLALGSQAIGAVDPDVLSNDTLGRLLKAQVLFELW